MTKQEVSVRVHKIIERCVPSLQLKYPDDNYKPISIDSLTIAYIMIEVEGVFNIEFRDTDLNYETFNSVRSLTNVITDILNL